MVRLLHRLLIPAPHLLADILLDRGALEAVGESLARAKPSNFPHEQWCACYSSWHLKVASLKNALKMPNCDPNVTLELMCCNAFQERH